MTYVQFSVSYMSNYLIPKQNLACVMFGRRFLLTYVNLCFLAWVLHLI
jgi:hypothetical protein